MTKKEKLLEKLQIQRELNIRAARKNLWTYEVVTASDFYMKSRWHLWVLAWTLQYLYERKLTKESFHRICTNKIVPEWFKETVDWDRLIDNHVYTKLMINLPPRFGKSRSIVNFCDWILGKSKDNRIITVSYNTDLAANMSRYVRDGIMMDKVDPLDTVFSDIFPETKVAKGNSGFMKWALEGSFFNYLGTGLDGTITGVGCTCFVKGTPILTDKGEVPIEEIADNPKGYKVLSYNHKDDVLEWQEVVASREFDTNDTVTLTTNFGRKITCTKDHRIFDGRVYREARTFREGNGVYTVKEQKKHPLCDMWQAQGGQRTSLQRVLSNAERYPDKTYLQALWENIHTSLLRSSESVKSWIQGHILLKEVQLCRPRRKKQQILSDMWEENFSHVGNVIRLLFGRVQGNRRESNKGYSEKDMPSLWKRISTVIYDTNILFNRMFRTLQRRWSNSIAVYNNFSPCTGNGFCEGQLQMCPVWGNGNDNRISLSQQEDKENIFELPSHRFRQGKQYNGKSDNPLHSLSFEIPRFENNLRRETIVKIESNSGEKQRVFDIQVRGNQNFFANWVLSHNCSIIDDPVKNAEEAYNTRVLDGIWDWYTGTFLSRSENIGDGSIDIINHTRWSTQDLCGRLLDKSDMGYKWLVLSIPAEYEGHLACEDILPREKYEELKSAMDKNIFLANYHQTPLDVEGRLFGTLKTYDETALAKPFEKIIAYCDTADEGSDYLACYIGGVREGEGYILDIIYTQDKMQVTEPLTARKLYENKVNTAKIESNNGGKGFARNVERLLWENHHSRQTHIDWFHQTQNKMARILTGATFVQDHVYFPKDWDTRFPELYQHITTFTKDGKNKHDDGVEALVEWGKMIAGEGSINSYMEYMKKLKEGR